MADHTKVSKGEWILASSIESDLALAIFEEIDS